MKGKKKKVILAGLAVLLVAFLIWPRKNSLGIENGTYTGGFDDHQSYITIYGDYFIWTGALYYRFEVVKENVFIIGKIEKTENMSVGIFYTGVKESPQFSIIHTPVWGSEDKGYEDMFVIVEEIHLSDALSFYKK